MAVRWARPSSIKDQNVLLALEGGDTIFAFDKPRLNRSPSRLIRDELDSGDFSRNTGIPLLPKVHWGTNICMFYESKVDLLDATVAYCKAGLDHNELCVWAISDPLTEFDVRSALLLGIPELDRHLKAGSLSVTCEEQWRLQENEFNLQRLTAGWTAKLAEALASGYSGLRITGNAAWLESHCWRDFCAFENELDRSVAGRKIILLCAQAQSNVKGEADYPVAAQAHHYTIACRNGQWSVVDPNDLERDFDGVEALVNEVDDLAGSLKSNKIFLTHREKAVLGLIVRGVSSREGGRMLGISPRTIEFHRSNIMQKLNVRNVAELVHTVLRNNEITGAK